jgi:hypothetical protein
MTKTSKPPATPRTTKTPREESLKIRTTIKCGYVGNDLGGDNPLFS